MLDVAARYKRIHSQHLEHLERIVLTISNIIQGARTDVDVVNDLENRIRRLFVISETQYLLILNNRACNKSNVFEILNARIDKITWRTVHDQIVNFWEMHLEGIDR